MVFKMSLFQPSELMQFLESIGQKPSKRLSQNFLIDGNILKKILAASSIDPGDLVIEIGPGPGVLTEALLQAGASVVAIEKDVVFADALARLRTPGKTLAIYKQDVLTFPFETFLKEHLKPGQKGKIISNLPYHLTSPIFDRILPLHSYIEKVVVMVQKEVADRIVARHGTKDMSSFSIFCQFYSDPSFLFSVSPNCFFPKPKVTSAVVSCYLKQPISSINTEAFFKMIRICYSARRKMLTTSLKEVCPQEMILKALREQDLKETARPEELSIENWLLLFHQLKNFFSL